MFAVRNSHAGTYCQVVLATVPFLGELLASGGDATRRAALDALIDLTGSFAPEPGQETFADANGSVLELESLLADRVRRLLPTVHALYDDPGCGDVVRKLARELCENLAKTTLNARQ